MFAIYKRELRAYFTTPLGYVFLGIYLAVSAAVFSFTTLFAMTSEVTGYFSTMLECLIVLLPLLTMKSFTEEKKQRTDQLLLTAPVPVAGIVTAKFLAAYTLFAGACVFSSLAFLFLSAYGTVKWAVLFGNVLALLLVGMAFIAVGVFVSSITESQLSAAIVTIVILLAFTVIALVCDLIPVYAIRFFFECLSVLYRFRNFANGIFDLAALFYYLSVTAVFLFMTMRVLDRRRWN